VRRSNAFDSVLDRDAHAGALLVIEAETEVDGSARRLMVR
jgi:hypothetical protein